MKVDSYSNTLTLKSWYASWWSSAWWTM